MKISVRVIWAVAVSLSCASGTALAQVSYPSSQTCASAAAGAVNENSYNAGFNAGYNAGFNPGYNTGYNFGYNNGYNFGFNPGYNTGYNAGAVQTVETCQSDPTQCGIQLQFQEGFDAGSEQTLATCQTDPTSCSIFLGNVLPPPEFGETEPNDNMVAADPLELQVKFWGQSYGADDADWFYFETADPNQTLNVNFAVPGTTPDGWLLYIRDANGNAYATVDTSSATTSTDEDGYIDYQVTLGLAGTYYIEVVSNVRPVSPNPYTLAIFLEDSPLDSGNYEIGFYDAEVEHNDYPSQANPLATGVTMYGLINLTFDVAVPKDAEYAWAQGEEDWFKYTAAESEIITLTFCGKGGCDPGNWLIEVYDEEAAALWEAGVSEQVLVPLLAYNTNNEEGSDTEPQPLRFGVQPGTYYMHVNHKRLFTAPCAGYVTDWDNNGIPSGPPGSEDQPQACACDSGYHCSIAVLNPTQVTLEDTTWPECPWEYDQSASGEPITSGPVEYCQATCNCEEVDGERTCSLYSDPNVPCDCSGTQSTCKVFLQNPGTPLVNATSEYGLCPDGSGGGTTTQCDIGCDCIAFGGVVEVPENEVTGQYNFSWYGTKLPPFTADSEAYQDFLNR